MVRKIKVACIGLGHMGKLHVMNVRFIDGVELTAAADQSKSALKKAESIGFKHLFSDYREIFGSVDIDAAIVCLPNFLHKDCVTLAAEHGIDVFLEKPLAHNVDDGREIVKKVKKYGIKLMVGYNYRFFDCVEELKRKLDMGFVGEIEIATLELILNGPFSPYLTPRPVPEWWFSADRIGGGPLFESGDHLVDLFRWFFGEPIKVLYACLDNHYNLPYEDTAITILRSDKTSTKGVINVGWFSRSIFPTFNFRVILHGTNNFVSTDLLIPRNLYLHAAKEAIKNIFRKITGRKIRPLTYTYYYSSYIKEMLHFFEAVRNDTEHMCTAEEGLRIIEILEECYRIAASLNHGGE